MAQRKYAGFSRGTLVDYASPERVKKLFEGDMGAIRSEYSRLRSIERKRMERMAEAGEIHNEAFRRFGNVQEQLPKVKELTDQQVLEMMTRLAPQIGGGYKATLSQISEARKDFQQGLRAEAEAVGDMELADALEKPLTPTQYDKVRRLMGMLSKVVGRTMSSSDVLQAATKQVLKGGKKESMLHKAMRALDDLGIDTDTNGTLAGESLKEKYTAKGTVRVSWSKSHGKRGK